MESHRKLDSYERGREDCRRQIAAGTFKPLKHVFPVDPPRGVHRQSWLSGWGDLRAEHVHPRLFTAAENQQAFIERVEAIAE